MQANKMARMMQEQQSPARGALLGEYRSRSFDRRSAMRFLVARAARTFEEIPTSRRAPDLVDLLRCVEWTEVSLKPVLQEAGLQPGAKWVVTEAADTAEFTSE
jgi:sulfane dehydrogenase subunit SoxC